jgi:hypothetical protein
MFSFRAYLVVAVVVGGIVFGIAYFLGDDIADWARDRQREAVAEGVSGLGEFITEPIIFVMENPSIGAVLAGLFWPFTFIWLLLLLVLLIIVAGTDVATDIDSQTSFRSVILRL